MSDDFLIRQLLYYHRLAERLVDHAHDDGLNVFAHTGIRCLGLDASCFVLRRYGDADRDQHHYDQLFQTHALEATLRRASSTKLELIRHRMNAILNQYA